MEADLTCTEVSKMYEVPEVPQVPMTRLLPFNQRLLHLVGAGDGMEMNQNGRRAKVG